MSKRILIIGTGLVVGKMMQVLDKEIGASVLAKATDYFLEKPETTNWAEFDMVVVACSLEKTRQVVQLIPDDKKVLDMSPTYRQEAGWSYGMKEIWAGTMHYWLRRHGRIANPGCMATAAQLIMRPMLWDNDGPLDDYDDVYLDTIIGYSAGGNKMVSKHMQSVLPICETVTSLDKEHPQIEEIKAQLRFNGSIVMTPKIGNFYSGIRMQLYVPGSNRDRLIKLYQKHYKGTNIVVDETTPKKIEGDHWANMKGACIHVYNQGAGSLVVCTMDNLVKGATESAMDNIKAMLHLE
jgi:N-acetyl-gamma-glutamylphosphate reductase